MEMPIQQEAFTGRRLAIRTAGLFKGPRLIIDGAEAKGRRQRYTVRDNSGKEVIIRLRTNHVDPIPKVEIGAKVIEPARRLRWYEYVDGPPDSFGVRGWRPCWSDFQPYSPALGYSALSAVVYRSMRSALSFLLPRLWFSSCLRDRYED
jgi:hypothetical protein